VATKVVKKTGGFEREEILGIFCYGSEAKPMYDS
jgi:hypothetical protein